MIRELGKVYILDIVGPNFEKWCAGQNNIFGSIHISRKGNSLHYLWHVIWLRSNCWERERETLSMWFLVRTVKKIRRGLTWNPLPAFHKQLVLLLSSSTVLLLLYSQTCLIVSLPLFFFLLSVWGFLTSFVSLQSMFHGFHSSSSSTMFSNSLFSPLFHDHFISCMRFHEISMKYYFLWLVLARL